MNPAYESLRQLVEGTDFSSPRKVLFRVSSGDACRKVEFLPYSIATNVVHADIWNRTWIKGILKEPWISPFPDFPIIEPNLWISSRSSFLEGLDQALELAQTVSDDENCKLLLRVAVHTSYHIGQIVLLKRSLKLSKEAG